MKALLIRTCAIAAVAALGAMAASAGAADAARGRALYENHCMVCHTPKVHTRPNRIPINVEELRQIVTQWAKEENLRWSREEVDDVVWYLNQTKYKY